MMRAVDETHDPRLSSFVASANGGLSAFPIQNLPFGVFRRRAPEDGWRVGVAIGDQVLDLRRCASEGLLEGLPDPAREACRAEHLGPLMAAGPRIWSALRRRLSERLREGATEGERVTRALLPAGSLEMGLPVPVRGYTDFYASVHHATRVGRLFRPENPLLPNYKHVPIAYHGRSSSIVPSGTPIRRPRGQLRPADATFPTFGPSRRLDYELEVGLFVGPGNLREHPIPIDEAEGHVFGLCLVNDWSARDIQGWEYQPLGPFLGKSFATSVSPWVVTLEALAPFRLPPLPRPEGDPRPLAYLSGEADARAGAIDLTLEVHLRSERMRQAGLPPQRLSCGSFRDMYWTIGQMLTHHTSNGCNLETGDLIASGTVSGPDPGACGCLLELTAPGYGKLRLPTGEERRFLEDGDEVVLSARCQRDGAAPISLGQCRGTVLPALP